MKKKLSEFKTADQRRNLLEDELSISLKNIKNSTVDKQDNVHCENNIGSVSVPLGVAGPIDIIVSEKKLSSHYIPLATTEGALVASVNRGCKAINEAKGAEVAVVNKGVTRSLVFPTVTLDTSNMLENFILNHQKEIKQAAESTSSHIKYLGIFIKKLPDYLFLRVSYDTDQAMGMNMATIASDEIAKFIYEKTGIKCQAISANLCVDKKPAWINFIEGRGRQLSAQVRLDKKILSEILHVKSEDFFQTWLAKNMVGSALSGSMGYNAHFANIIAAYFIATGQDPAHTVEGSLGLTTAKILPGGDLMFSIYLPSVMLGVVGGGTNLATQTEARAITNTKSVDDLAAVLAAAVLAGEISLLSSIAEGSLSVAHRRLGR